MYASWNILENDRFYNSYMLLYVRSSSPAGLYPLNCVRLHSIDFASFCRSTLLQK